MCQYIASFIIEFGFVTQNRLVLDSSEVQSVNTKKDRNGFE